MAALLPDSQANCQPRALLDTLLALARVYSHVEQSAEWWLAAAQAANGARHNEIRHACSLEWHSRSTRLLHGRLTAPSTFGYDRHSSRTPTAVARSSFRPRSAHFVTSWPAAKQRLASRCRCSLTTVCIAANPAPRRRGRLVGSCCIQGNGHGLPDIAERERIIIEVLADLRETKT